MSYIRDCGGWIDHMDHTHDKAWNGVLGAETIAEVIFHIFFPHETIVDRLKAVIENA
jgi:hypothetical protein